MAQSVFVALAQDQANGEVVAIAAGVSAAAARAAVEAKLRTAFDAIGPGDGVEFVDWLAAFSVTEPELVDISDAGAP